jgi:hypothetical protein
MSDDKAPYYFDSVGEDVFLLVDGQRIAKTKFLAASGSKPKWTIIAEGWTVSGDLGRPIIHPPLPPAA